MVTGSKDPGQTARRTLTPGLGSGSPDRAGRPARTRDRTKARSRRTASAGRSANPSGQAGSGLRADRSTTTSAPGTSQPCATSACRSSATAASASGYGGSRKTTSYGAAGGRRSVPATGAGDHVGAGEADRAGVLGDQRGGAAVLLDQRDHAGAARPGLEADRAGPGVQVEEAQAVQRAAPRLDGREQRLAHPVAGRAGCARRGGSRGGGRRPRRR